MKFGEISLSEAEGAILAHSLKLKDATFKKGRVLSAEDLERLDAEGVSRITAARLEADDVAENEAAARVAARLGGVGTRAGGAFTGRCNLFADERGLLEVDAEMVNALNAVDEAITVATLPDHAVVTPKQMIATVKIIPFAVNRAHLERVENLLSVGEAALKVAPFKAFRAGLVQTRLAGVREAVLDKTKNVLSGRVAGLGGRVVGEQRCSHTAAAVADAIDALVAQGADMVLIAGASAIVDRRDVVPAGIVAAGGEISHFGMPMDPGNLMLLARRGPVAVIGLPGCARSPKYNGIDEVLRRLAAGIAVDGSSITGLGVGGLLKETPHRPLPRALGEAEPAPEASRPRVFALVLAAGQSRRMGDANKLLLELDGVALIRRVVAAVRASSCEEVIVVTGHEASRVEAALAGAPVRTVRCADYGEGLSASLRAGVGALPADCEAVVVCLGDMPGVSASHVDRLIAAFDPLEGRSVCVPTFKGKRGNPVLWERRFFSELAALQGDVGARHLIGEHAELVCEVEMDDPGVLVDVDTPQALESLKSKVR